MTVTLDQLTVIMPAAAAAGRLKTWYGPLVEEMISHAVTTPAREAMFLATVAEETGELSAQVEASYFGTPWARIAEVFGAGKPGGVKGLTADVVAGWKALGRQGFDEAFFNHVYADANRPPGYRVGNINPGDGWRYRGRGPMGLTGKQNYERFFRDLGLPADSDPDLLLDPAIGAKSACHFWQKNGCNEIADTGDFYALTKRVNGTHMNMNLRMPYFVRAKAALAAPVSDITEPPPGTVRQPDGNIVIRDIKDSTILRDSTKGQGIGTVAATAGAAAPIITAASGMDWKLALVLGVVVLIAGAGALYYFDKVKRARRKMHADGVA